MAAPLAAVGTGHLLTMMKIPLATRAGVDDALAGGAGGRAGVEDLQEDEDGELVSCA